MLILIVVLAVVVFLAGVAVLALVVTGIHAEERHMTLTCGPEWPRTLASAASRPVLGVYVRRPQKAPHREPEDSAPLTRVGGQ
jgi:hypothetical protein